MKNILLSSLFAVCIAPAVSLAQGTIDFEENHTQYPQRVKYKVGVGAGTTLFMEKNCFTYVKYDPAQLEAIHDNSHQEGNHDTRKRGVIDLHAFRMTFTGANPSPIVSAMNPRPYYSNYFLGNNPARWSSYVASYNEVFYTGLYSGINLAAYSVNNQFKYDFLVAPGADPSQIRMEFTGTDGIEIQNNMLIIHLSTGDMIEQVPYSYQTINNVKIPVACEYFIEADGKTVTFKFPNGYNQSFQLTIDPVLVAATYSGAPAATTTFGHCATYDPSGNIYTGGECFNAGYPTQAGSFQTTFSGGVDIAVAKLNPNGSNLLWSTYIGGSSQEIPNSLYAVANGELYVLGATGSTNYPTTAGCFDATHNGTSGADDDIVVSHVNANGTALIGSTYVGGSGNDGGGWGMPWNMNGHDGMRGEIVVDAAGNAWVASFSESANFPTTPGCYDNSLGGSWDGVVFRLNPTCATLGWSTFIGGSSADGAYGLRVNAANEVFCTGVTCSNDFPATPGTYDGNYNGGISDGFIARFNNTGNTLVAATYFGTPSNEICYFMDTDASGSPYVYGTSTGNMPVTAGVYSNPGASNFVAKFDPFLFTLTFGTVFGSGPANYLEPEAFMVDSCENIYCSGFNSQSTYPVTANALYPTQASCGGGSAYFIVLSKNALQLSFGSFYYGWHVDGGTSRFDPSGAIYQGICIGGGGAPTPAWAWKNNVNAPGWDMFVVKIDFQTAGVNAIASAAPNDSICENTAVTFTNTSNGFQYYWNFDDGSPIDTNAAPTHVFGPAGTYNVMLIAVDSNSCNVADTMYLTITVLPTPEVILGPDSLVCGPINIILDATSPGCTYQWSTGATTPTITVTSPATYWVIVDNGVCSDADSVDISQFALPDIGSDTAICTGQTLVLDAGNPGATYQWNTGAQTQTIPVSSSGLFWVDVTSGPCTFRDSIDVQVVTVAQPDLGADTAVCPGSPVSFSVVNPGATITWSDGTVGSSFSTDSAGTYWVTVSLGNCEETDTVMVTFLDDVELGSALSLCNVDQGVTLDAGNPGSSYLWSNGATTQTISVTEAGTYYVDVINTSNCNLTDTIVVTGELGGGTLYVPNTFTPNGDGKNDVFCPAGTGITEFKMQIFDRWGMLLFESSSLTTNNTTSGCWDGTFRGNKVQEDTYVVRITYRTECGDKNLHKGYYHVNVLR
jgi:gliding motility-associated-like protein